MSGASVFVKHLRLMGKLPLLERKSCMGLIITSWNSKGMRRWRVGKGETLGRGREVLW